ncbi:G-type lectin S-receptor-like serine/threonine-protein kinase At4g27290 isoform X1 [Olea europaea var. sylvestris]|uniref:Receptor-like serine/threonine-protein kinase n=1 Tax=Olea europaea subsp. europaea TaxID=158383 RepID=A0A8S0RU64_OLEEU|nr:G-type lectin S-receptor-like serine/threonine-protein kinase At4g27290 isoform X1 [Olea europaea var. sylvestris]CAA2982886.1 G-type lectin S-receptor-like serine threonine-kinase At4g27290 isoform X1 [Olea europaea subsp. europaea]
MLQSQFTVALIYSLTFLKLSVAADTLSANQTIRDGQILVSEGEIFELGFFSPGNSNNRFLGIWYKTTPDVVFWVANRNNPIIDSQGILSIARNGTLLLKRGKTIIWSSNTSSVASIPVVRLLNTGNLVIMNSTSQQNYIWQSFDYPCDTRLPGMELVDYLGQGQDKYLTSWRSSHDPSIGDFSDRIEYNGGLVEMVVYHGKIKRCRRSPWSGHYTSNLPFILTTPFKPVLVFNKDRISLYDNSSLITRFNLDKSGFVHRYTMNESKNGWNLVQTFPRDFCDNYARCGPNGICRISQVPICECLKGFAPRFQKDWDVQDWSGGCVRITPINCQNGDGFLGVEANFPDRLQFQLNTSMNFNECQAQCSKSCSCTAFATPFITGVSSCLMWFGDLIDIREPPGADSKVNIYIRLPPSELESNNVLGKKKKRPAKIIFILTAVGVLIPALICGGILLKRRLTSKGEERKTEGLELPSFDLATVAAATDNFSSKNMIGEGGFGPVYRGRLSDGQGVAVKRLSKTSRQGIEEFKNEVNLIAKLQHRNLVRLLGCCTKRDERMLIYEYMENRSLDNFIFDEDKRTILSWHKRFDIIMGIARGFLYLHHDSRLKIIHRDIKTSNILLDEYLNPKISDFGLARIVGGGHDIERTKRVIGTYGYMAPEYAFDGKFSVKSDIFSMGVVLLEIVSGKKNRSFRYMDHCDSLLGHAWLLWKEDKALELMDECLKDSYVESQVKRCIHMGLLCVQKHADDRPFMSNVLFVLGSDQEGANLPDPNEPGFFMGGSYNIEGSCKLHYNNEETCKPEPNSNAVSMTDIEAR